MMKKILLLVFPLFFSAFAFSQPSENSWINYNQDYYKIKIAQDGIYRISAQALNFAGFPTTGIDPRKIRMYHNGIEQFLYIQGENDGAFDASDYIEFFGRKNDGSFDKSLYADSSWHPSPSYSLFNDTSAYFLTYSPLTNGSRVTVMNNNNFNSFSPAPYFIRESYLTGKDVPNAGLLFGYNRGWNSESIDYTESEGWGAVFGNYSGGNYPINISVPTEKLYSGGTAPDAEMEMCIGGVNNNPHNLVVTFPGVNFTDTYYYQTLHKYNFTVPLSAITSASSTCNLNVSSPTYPPEYSMFYWLSLKYPHSYDLNGDNKFQMLVPDDPQGYSRMDITNFNDGGSVPVIYDLTNHRKFLVVQNGNTFQSLVDNDNSGNTKEVYISSVSSIQSASLTKINYQSANPGRFNDFGALGLDSAFIIITHQSLMSAAQDYYNYRNTHAPNINRCLLVNIDELYDQFAYGIEKHPLSVKNFSRYVLNTWPTEAQHIFLIGKSISPADYRNNPGLYEKCMVASYGVPTSDILMTAGINGSLWEPKIPIGRISAQVPLEVTDYLHKVEEYETVQAGPPQPWQKEILHFGGGNDTVQQNLLAGYLGQYESILEDSLFGGHVTTYLKFSTSPIQINLADTLQAQLDSGVAIMTFFGHASGSTFDISTDEPSAYQNHGRYPMVFANSCFSGDFHSTQKSVSEKFVLEPEKAAIGFLASVGLGNPPFLLSYTKTLFQHASYSDYGATIGQLMKKTIQDIQVLGGTGEKQVASEMSLQGDPAIRLNSFDKPDYSIDESKVYFTPSYITTDLDTFNVKIITRNYGKAVQDSFVVRITHTYPNGIDSVYTFKRGRCYYSDELTAKLFTGGFSGAGFNKLKVEIDLPDSVNEYENYLNNSTTSDFFIYSKDIIPVYPPDYSIHPYNTVTLKASTANPLAGLVNYRFEIDTLDLNLKDITPGMTTSPLFRTFNLVDSGGVLSWNPPNYFLQDSVVYFWRVANDSIQYDTASFHWQQSSFIYIPGKTGWAQTHFHQFKSDGYENIRYDTLGRKFDFVNNVKALKITTKGYPDGTQTQYNEIGYTLNNSPVEYNGCTTNSAIMVAILDSISLEPWTTCGNNFGQFNQFTLTSGNCGDPIVLGSGNCRNRPENYFIFHMSNPSHMDSLNSLLNRIPNKDYVILYSWYTYPYSTANPSFHSALSSLGINTANMNDNHSFIYFIQKGDTSTLQELYGTIDTISYSLNATLTSVWNRGNINTVTIGPSTRWESLHWNQHPKEALPMDDVVYLNIIGLNSNTNVWDTIARGVQYNTGKDTTLNWISAIDYPYIRLQSYLQDYTLNTPPQMDYWRIYYDEAPECALNPNRTFSFYNNPIQEGDTVRLSIAIDNIGNIPMDSLGVSFFLYDNNRRRYEIKNYKLDSLRSSQSLIASISIDTTFNLAGDNSLWVEANPFIAPYHQVEKYHFNNLAEIKFKMDRDKINPILDVTFDGTHILNGDIVSGKPQIIIRLHDENRFLALNDSGNFKVLLTTPGSNTPININWNTISFGQLMRFTPAVLPHNSCQISWNPTLSEDGKYWLEVEATDRSNNESGKYNYKISFEVINKSTITEVLNYPNPFSTSTRFVFTLTGNEVPTGMKIQVMTVTGKIIREIMQNELGNIHIGRNITDYAWDGKDEFGDQLANGLYLYRVVTDLHGEAIERRATDIDKFFKKGWGKMYLMR